MQLRFEVRIALNVLVFVQGSLMDKRPSMADLGGGMSAFCTAGSFVR